MSSTYSYAIRGKPRGNLTFLDLPSELRMTIYELCLSFRAIIKHPPSVFDPPPTVSVNTVNGVNTSLLRVNKIIYNESVDVLYGNNTFEIHLPYVLSPWMKQLKPYPHQVFKSFLQSLSDKNRLLIRRMELHSKLLFVGKMKRDYSIEAWRYMRLDCLMNQTTDIYECLRIQHGKQLNTGVQRLHIVFEHLGEDDWSDLAPDTIIKHPKWTSAQVDELSSVVVGLKNLRHLQIDGMTNGLGNDFIKDLVGKIEARNIQRDNI